jgi:intraflagellar transport protein 74
MYPSSRQTRQNQVNTLNSGLRAPTGYKKIFTNNLTYAPNINIGERPVTQHGMLGMKTGVNGPKRKILSRSYFLVLLKKKIGELTEEIVKFREEKEKRKTENEVYLQMSSKHEILMEEVRELEGQLADFNLAFDKQRNGTKPEYLINVEKHLTYQNEKISNQVDAIFIERKNYEDKIMAFEERIKELQNNAEVKINELNNEEKEEFFKLKVQVKEAEQSNKFKKRKLEELDRGIIEQQQLLRMDMNRLKFFELKEDKEKIEKKEKELQEELQDCKLSFEELRKKLMEEVKVNKKEIQKFEKRVKELNKLSNITYKKLQKIENILEGKGEIADEEKQKYEILYNKEKEVEQSLEQHKELFEKRLRELELQERTNYIILNSISKNTELIKKTPQKEELIDKGKEYKYKKVQAENSEHTLLRIQKELIRRQDDMKKVDEIEETLPQRIRDLKDMVAQMKEEILIFDKKDDEKKRLEKMVENLKQKLILINDNKEDLQNKVKIAEEDYRKKLKKLQSHSLFNIYIEKEKQLSQINQLKFGIKNYIDIKENEANYGIFVETLQKLTEEVNAALISKIKN